MKFNALMPELYVTNFQKSLDFYTKILGFKVEYTRSNPNFAFMSYEGAQLMLEEYVPEDEDEYVTGKFEYPLGRGINFEIKTADVEKILDTLKENNYPLRRELKEKWRDVGKGQTKHGSCEFMVQDPDGYLLRFSQDIAETP